MKTNFLVQNLLTMFWYRNIRTYTLFLTCTLLASFNSKALVTVQELESSYKGYSIEQVPGMDEFVVAGTFYVDGLNQQFTGYHFMHLDANGNALISNYVFPDPMGLPQADWEMRVVDIVVQDANNYWIVMSVRENNPTVRDYIFAEKVDISIGGAPGAAPNQITVSNFGSGSYENAYPTHSIYKDDYLYICGYLSDQRSSPSIPTNVSAGKKGMISRTYVGTGAGLPDEIVAWDTPLPPSGAAFDYDMALKMQHTDVDIYLTGTGNSNVQLNSQAGAIIMHFDMPNLNTMAGPNLVYDNLITPPAVSNGIYGIDLFLKNDDIFVLCNKFENNAVQQWGVLRVDAFTLQAHPTFPSYFETGETPPGTDWVKQFLPDPNQLPSGYAALAVVGEKQGEYGSCPTPSPYNPPMPTNVNPFISTYEFWWNNTPGFNQGINFNFLGQVIHASDLGTSNVNLDYLMNTPTAGTTDLEDFSRLNTFAHRFSLNPGDDEIVLITPLRNNNLYPQQLNTKFMRLNGTGNELDCANEWGCLYDFSAKTLENVLYNPDPPIPTTQPQIGLLKRRVINVYYDDCQNGVFKPTSVENTIVDNTIAIFPNPASTELNIDFDNAKGTYSFTLTDITGKIVLNNSGNIQASTLSIQLPQLSSGMYIATVETSGNTHTEKINIQ